MRISDWSSDVCSSDLGLAHGGSVMGNDDRQEYRTCGSGFSEPLHPMHHLQPPRAPDHVGQVLAALDLDREADRGDVGVALQVFDAVDVGVGFGDGGGHLRSEEYTSSPPSLMRHSYAVF